MERYQGCNCSIKTINELQGRQVLRPELRSVTRFYMLLLGKAQTAYQEKAKQVVGQHVLWGNLSPKAIFLRLPHVHKWEKKCC